MSKFLITGGAGFIGLNYLYNMLDKYPNDVFVCLDNLKIQCNINYLNKLKTKPNFKFVKMDICNKEDIFRLFHHEKFDYVINFAAETHVDNSIKDPEIFFKTNVLGTQVLMDACREYGIKRFHQVSTDEVYGDIAIYEDSSFDEKSLLCPSNPYSASKASADLLVLAYHRTYKLPVTISRCSNNYGPFQHEEKLIPLMIKKALNNEKLPVYGNGSNVRDWLYVGDHCSAIDLIVRYGKDGEVYNIAGHNEKTNIEVVKTILKVLGKSEDLVSFVNDRLGHDLRYAINDSKINKQLQWERKYDFDLIIADIINWYKTIF